MRAVGYDLKVATMPLGNYWNIKTDVSIVSWLDTPRTRRDLGIERRRP
jgi:hypothetical protein